MPEPRTIEERRTPGGPPFFIVGSARSGTTWLRMMLNAHPDVAVPPESRFIVELWRGADEIDSDELLGRLARHKRFQAWELPIEHVRRELPPRPDYGGVMAAAYVAFARRRAKTRWGDKTPRYVSHIPFLARLFPDARFVHVVRDGRDVALSYADVSFGPKSVAHAAELWAERVRAGRAAGRSLPGRYLEARYESFVAEPEANARTLCGFVGVGYDPGMLEYTERSKGEILARAARFNPHVGERPQANLRSWEQSMPASHVEIFEAVAGDLLAELGYPRRYDAPRPHARTAAALGRLGLPVGCLRRSRSRGGRGGG